MNPCAAASPAGACATRTDLRDRDGDHDAQGRIPDGAKDMVQRSTTRQDATPECGRTPIRPGASLFLLQHTHPNVYSACCCRVSSRKVARLNLVRLAGSRSVRVIRYFSERTFAVPRTRSGKECDTELSAKLTNTDLCHLAYPKNRQPNRFSY